MFFWPAGRNNWRKRAASAPFIKKKITRTRSNNMSGDPESISEGDSSTREGPRRRAKKSMRTNHRHIYVPDGACFSSEQVRPRGCCWFLSLFPLWCVHCDAVHGHTRCAVVVVSVRLRETLLGPLKVFITEPELSAIIIHVLYRLLRQQGYLADIPRSPTPDVTRYMPRFQDLASCPTR